MATGFASGAVGSCVAESITISTRDGTSLDSRSPGPFAAAPNRPESSTVVHHELPAREAS